MPSRSTWKTRWAVLLLGGAAALAGCATHGRAAELRPVVADGASALPAPASADATARSPLDDPAEVGDYDPWEPFNERMFAFNRGLDRWVVKPAATGWRKVVPEPFREGLQNAFHNLGMPRRFVNSHLQDKLAGAGRELGGFLVNSTLGLGGLVNIAQREGWTPSNGEDTGQTLGVWGIGPGPYLVLPFMPPMTVRDGVGFAVDSLLNPVGYVAPFVANAGLKGTDTINTRAENLEVFEDVEESVLDLYSAVRNGYLQRRQKAIGE